MLLDHVRDFIEEKELLREARTVVVGLSGGVDSIVLAYLLRRLGYATVAAHVNYGLRSTATGDEALVRRFCASFTPPLPLHVDQRDAQARAEEHGSSLQEAARYQRYAFFEEVAEEEGARHVAVAHHRDDQAETVLLHLLRGTGPEGLAGMRARRRLNEERRAEGGKEEVWVVRPLLTAGREHVEAYARTHDLPWREDESNRDLRFKRAVLRKEVLPVLEAHFPGAAERLARSAALTARYVDEALRPELQRRFEEAREPASNGGALRLDALHAAPPVWQGRLLLEGLCRWCPGASRTQAVARELQKLLDAQPGRRTVFGTGCVWRERDVLRFEYRPEGEEPPLQEHPPQEQALVAGGAVRWPGGIVRADRLDARPDALESGGAHTAFLDAERVQFPLTVRVWQAGDRLQPLGMEGHKSVSDLLTDAKVPPSKRRHVRVVCSGETIVWVVGHRLAESAKVRPSTRHVVRLTFESLSGP